MLQTVRKRDLAKPLGSALRISEEGPSPCTLCGPTGPRGQTEDRSLLDSVESRHFGGRLAEYEHEIWFPDDFE